MLETDHFQVLTVAVAAYIHYVLVPDSKERECTIAHSAPSIPSIDIYFRKQESVCSVYALCMLCVCSVYAVWPCTSCDPV